MAKQKSNEGRASLPTSEQPRPPTHEEMKSRGEEAARLLDSPVFNLAHRSVVQNLQDEWMETSPHEERKREGLYHRIQALSAISSELAAMVATAQTMNEDAIEVERRSMRSLNENEGFAGHSRRA